MATKIATCCYCGTRAALVLKGKDRHELACATCGAPLHEMKMLRADHEEHGLRELVKPSKVRSKAKPSKPAPKKSKSKPKKKRKSFFKRVFDDVIEEAFDAIEDIFD